VPADLSPSETRLLAGVMLRLHAAFRERHRLPPLPTAWTLPDHLEALGSRSSLVEPRALLSRRGGIAGSALNAARRAVWEILKPLFHRQSEVNRDVLQALEALARDRDTRRTEHHILSARIWALERRADRQVRRGADAGSDPA
jgi:hypothetical protein